MELQREGDVLVLALDEDSLVFNAGRVDRWEALLDEVEAVEGPAALVVTGSGRSFHQGLDLQWVLAQGEATPAFLRRVHQLFGRLLRLDLPTAAAINGHAQAAGAMLAMCLDLRVMRADRGWFRLPEVEIGLPFTVVMGDLLAARIPQPALHRLMVLGQQVGGAEAAAAGIVDGAVEGEGGALAATIEQIAPLAARRGPIVRQIRTALHAGLLASIDADADRADVFVRSPAG